MPLSLSFFLSETRQLIATLYCRGTGVRITIVTAHTDSPMHVSKMDTGVVQAPILHYIIFLPDLNTHTA